MDKALVARMRQVLGRIEDMPEDERVFMLGALAGALERHLAWAREAEDPGKYAILARMKRLLARYRAWRGEPMHWTAELAWLADEILDQVPRREDGTWSRYGQWGCTLRLARWWASGERKPRRPASGA